MSKSFTKFYFIVFCIAATAGCGQTSLENASTSVSGPYLYVTTGTCYSGNGITTFNNTAASNLVYRLNLSTGQKDMLLADYYSNPANPGDSPVSIVDNDADSILVLIENTTTTALRRIEKLEKRSYGNRSTFNGNTVALSAQVRRMIRLQDNYLLVSKSTAVEKILQTASRLTIGANAWLTMSSPASSCTPSVTIITALEKLTNGTLVFAHAGTGNSRIGTVSPLGYGAALDCKSTQAAPVATTFPTAMAYDAVNAILIVAYGATTTAANMNSIYTYSVDESSGAISNPQKIYDANLFGSDFNYLLFGIPSMTLDPSTNTLYVATAVSTTAVASNYKIEKFKYSPSLIGTNNNEVLNYQGSFYNYGNDTKCISSMMVAQ